MKIGELAAATGTTTKALRFYERVGLLPAPERTPAGYRDYSGDAVARLNFIRRSQSAGLALAQIREILDIRDAGQAACHHVQQLLQDRLAGIDGQIADLMALRATVAALHDHATTVEPSTCAPAIVCRYQ
ncbi:heavy metal-responsive transcriptional regulator [Blastococcus goldschmidtiae]|uniref:Heavy metal-responsive transcriptional regulator n=1 Tax=Blastococcus goldschmidtiae TaxID=3075546 RepID=A0ABU2KDF8_9ACTN|nr:heavy metal-responsive transcriptional regulator [Blastococcus sp. DSM 46792]MDT0278229.1 heavy metal-responsive transcriptional regulator [Blastococcus sp. DSM 46792]